MTERLSVVIPTLNEEEEIEATLRGVLADEQVSECLVIDGGSSDRTVDLVGQFNDPRLQLHDSPRGRAQQLNTGLQAAGGDVVLLLHADTQMPANFAGQILQAVATGAQWGGFRHQFHPNNWQLAAISWLHNWRCSITGVVYGDQAMYVRKAFALELGGFPTDTIEDLAFSDLAVAQSPPTMLTSVVRTSSRKFRQIGEFRAFLHVVSIIRRYEKQKKIGNARFFRDYR